MLIMNQKTLRSIYHGGSKVGTIVMRGHGLQAASSFKGRRYCLYDRWLHLPMVLRKECQHSLLVGETYFNTYSGPEIRKADADRY
jgi:hypothetical protein